jgi:hypothetical protein
MMKGNEIDGATLLQQDAQRAQWKLLKKKI